jgi:hypothetical protein
MKFGVVCDVEGRTYLDGGGTIEYGGMRYTFYVKDIKEPLLTQIRIISDVDDPEQYSFHSTQPGADGKFTVTQRFEPHIQAKLIRELQTLESLLGTLGNIKRVYWNKATFEYYPETEAEFKRFNVLPPFFFMHEVPMDDPAVVSMSNLAPYLKRIETLNELAEPMSFYREAKAEYSTGRYINSFFSSYFIIEGLFGKGLWRKRDIVRELTQSPVFSNFVQNYLDEVSTNQDPGKGMTKVQLTEELQKGNQPFTVEGLITQIVETRGRLHHFSFISTQPQGTPFNHLDYKRISLITFIFAGQSLTHYVEQALSTS